MKRIDSVNARPDANGAGKAGFSDNADLNGQDATYLTPEWLNTLQEEICNVIEKNGHDLDSSSKQQLWEVLASKKALLAHTDAISDEDDPHPQYAKLVAMRTELDELRNKINREIGEGDFAICSVENTFTKNNKFEQYINLGKTINRVNYYSVEVMDKTGRKRVITSPTHIESTYYVIPLPNGAVLQCGYVSSLSPKYWKHTPPRYFGNKPVDEITFADLTGWSHSDEGRWKIDFLKPFSKVFSFTASMVTDRIKDRHDWDGVTFNDTTHSVGAVSNTGAIVTASSWNKGATGGQIGVYWQAIGVVNANVFNAVADNNLNTDNVVYVGEETFIWYMDDTTNSSTERTYLLDNTFDSATTDTPTGLLIVNKYNDITGFKYKVFVGLLEHNDLSTFTEVKNAVGMLTDKGNNILEVNFDSYAYRQIKSDAAKVVYQVFFLGGDNSRDNDDYATLNADSTVKRVVYYALQPATNTTTAT